MGEEPPEKSIMPERKSIPVLALSIAASLCAALPLMAQYTATDQGGQRGQGDPPAQVARIGDVQGDVSFMAAGATQWSAGEANYPMTSGDRLYADQNSRAEIQNGSTDVRMWQSTDVTLTNLTNQYEQLGLAQGSIRVRVYEINQGGTVEVDTPNGSAVITQPGDYRIDAYGGDSGSDVIVNSGAVQITGPNGLNQEVSAGQAVQMTGTDQVQLTSLNMPAFDGLDDWSIERDHQILNSQSARYVSRDTPGYSDLDANGSWSPSPDYGPVWYPSNVPVGWAPYSEGHWAYVAPWGYTWIDNEPWGYAPFHYGRWSQFGGRWGWVPGPPAVAPVYSPALVAFVGGSGFSIGIGIGGGGGVAAWFPLGVGEPYTPWYHCTPNYARQVNVTNVNITNIHNTTIVNNYNTYISNTRTVNNVSQLRTNNIQYVNRAHVTAVPESAMSTGRPVAQAAVKLTPPVRQQLLHAPVHAPTAPVPTHPLLPVRTNIKAPVARPTLVTARGVARAVPAANPARLAPAALPKPKPATALPKPVAGAVAGRPVPARPGTPANNAIPANNAVRPPAPGRPVPPAANTSAPVGRPAVPGNPGNYNGRPNTPAPVARPIPAPTTRPVPPPAYQRPQPVDRAPVNPRPVAPPPTRPETRPAPPPPTRRPAPEQRPPAPVRDTRPAPPPPRQAAPPPPRQTAPPPPRQSAPPMRQQPPPPQRQPEPARANPQARPAPPPQPQHREPPPPPKHEEHPQAR